MAEGHGGARAGAGRRPTAETFQSEIAAAKGRIADRLPSLIDNLFRLADGVTVMEAGEDGEPAVYAKPPDRAANVYLLDRILGRPTQAVELSGPDGGEIPVSSRPDPARLSLEELAALESLLFKATPAANLYDGNTDARGGAG